MRLTAAMHTTAGCRLLLAVVIGGGVALAAFAWVWGGAAALVMAVVGTAVIAALVKAVAEIASNTQTNRVAMARQADDQQRTSEGLASTQRAVDDLTDQLATAQADQASRSEEFGERLSALDAALRAQGEDTAHQVEGWQSAVAARLSKAEKAIERSADEHVTRHALSRMPAANAGRYQPFNREAVRRDLVTLAEDWGKRLGFAIDVRELAYLSHRIGATEEQSLGRLAASVESMLLRMMVARAALEATSRSGEDLKILEIGTLFGIGLGLLYEACRDRGTAIHLVAIDPLDGYYGNNRADIITGVPVTREVLRENMSRIHVPENSWELLQAFSSEALTELAERDARFQCIVVDADHSYEGVKADFEGTIALLAPGGYLLFDDYGSDDWPDIKAFVDEHLLSRRDLQLIGSGFNTIVFRSVGP
jgi:predicted O-methyltransferase YrrM